LQQLDRRSSPEGSGSVGVLHGDEEQPVGERAALGGLASAASATSIVVPADRASARSTS
jgi:hypothetical protein